MTSREWVIGLRWDPTEYLRFAGERGRPFADLMSRVTASAPSYVVDLGCGPGNLTRTLAERWPDADVEGVDNSAEMIERGRREGGPVRFTLADLRDWEPRQPVDVLTCNATLQWVPGHIELLDRFVAMLAPGGWLAVQLPGNFAEPSHTQLAALCRSPRWRPLLAPHDLPVPSAAEPVSYLRRLARPGRLVDVWETTYLQVLPGADAVLRWMEGTALRPVLSALDDEQRKEFTEEYAAGLRTSYPRERFGTVLPYRRIFAVVHLEEAP